MSSKICSDFVTQSCEDFCVRVADGTHDSPKETPDGKMLVTSKNVKGGRLSLDTAYFISLDDFNAINKRSKVDQWDLLLTMIGTVGEVCLVDQATPDFAIKNVGLLKCGDELRAKWLYYFLRSPQGQGLIEQRKKGSTQQYISLTEIRKLPISYPRYADEMKAALDTLSSLDDRIILLRETNATLEAIAQALFKSWFVDFDPVRAKAKGLEPEGMDAATSALFPDSFEESELGGVPKGWKMSTLGAICEPNGGAIQTGPFGSQLHASDYVAFGVPVVMPKDISIRRVDATTAARILPEDADRLMKHQLRGGDIIFSRRGDVEKHALIGERERGWLCGTGCLLVRPGTRRKVSGYLSRSLDLLQTKKWLTQHAVGATMPNLNTGILSGVPVLLPSDEVLAAFEQVASAFDEHISENNATAKTLTELRDTLLPRLISGQLRLPETDASIRSMLSEAV
jgi:type I restriction enzyme S subunit